MKTIYFPVEENIALPKGIKEDSKCKGKRHYSVTCFECQLKLEVYVVCDWKMDHILHWLKHYLQLDNLFLSKDRSLKMIYLKYDCHYGNYILP